MPLFTDDSIIINAPVSTVWDALINPELTKQYMFGCEAKCSWKVGDPIEWIGSEDGVVYVKGSLVTFEPNKRFAFTVFDPHGSYADIPENYLTATYTLTPEGGNTHLNVIQGDYEKVAEGNKRYQDTMDQGGWNGVLESLKKIVETHEP
ncbi:MAG: ATPase [Cyclobacteriaceae bacterium]|nr:MAG: ATPase [Cyclobacteriaceae bacterium]